MFGTTSVAAADLSATTATQLGFFFMLGIYAIFTAMLYYHWHTYAEDRVVTRLTFVLYFLVTLPCMGVMGLIAFVL